MLNAIHYIPLISSVVSYTFAAILFQRWSQKPGAAYLGWWAIGVLMYGLGTTTEALTTLFGWNPIVFKLWYVTGALLGAAPLAQGTVYLLLSKKVADILSIIIIIFTCVAALFVFLSPVNMSLVEPDRLAGKVMEWSWTRLFSPFLNIYAFIFLVGGAIYSAWKYWGQGAQNRVWGNVLIAVGALLPGIGGSFTRMGYVEVLYVTELIGIILIWIGYARMSADLTVSVHPVQRANS